MSEICPRKPTRSFVYNFMFEIHSLLKIQQSISTGDSFIVVIAERRFNESNLLCTNLNAQALQIF